MSGPVGRRLVSRLAIGETLRLMPRGLITSAAIVAPAYVALRTANNENVTGTMQFLTVALAMLAAFWMNDDAAAIAAATPTPLWLRTAWRVGLVTVWTGLVWVVCLAVAELMDPVGTSEAGLPTRTWHLAMLTAVAIVTGLIGANRDPGMAGPAGSTIAATLAAGALIAPMKWPITLIDDPVFLRRDLSRIVLPLVVLVWIGVHDRGKPRRARRLYTSTFGHAARQAGVGWRFATRGSQMSQWEESTTIKAGADEVFAYVSDLKNHADWSGHELQVTKDDTGPIAVGSSYSTVAKQFGTQREQSIVTDLDSPTLFGWDSTGGLGVVHHTFTVREDDGVTTLTRAAEFKSKKFLAKMLGSRLNKDLPASLREDLVKIKAKLEG